MTEDSQLQISGHPNEWVALIGSKVVATSQSFETLVKKLQTEKLLNKATVTRVSGTHAIL